MKKTLRAIVGMGFAVVMITACADKQEEVIVEETETSTVGSQTTVQSTPTPRPTPSAPSPTDFSATPTPAPTPTPQAQNYPSGISVSDKPGYVRSPHSPDAGLVDVRGIPPGTEVRDPYSGRIFLVP